jgi:hypothetical protein
MCAAMRQINIPRIVQQARIFSLRLVLDLHQLRRPRKRQRFQQHRVDQTKDCGVNADREAKNDHRGDSEPRRLQQFPKSQSRMTEQQLHHFALNILSSTQDANLRITRFHQREADCNRAYRSIPFVGGVPD